MSDYHPPPQSPRLAVALAVVGLIVALTMGAAFLAGGSRLNLLVAVGWLLFSLLHLQRARKLRQQWKRRPPHGGL